MELKGSPNSQPKAQQISPEIDQGQRFSLQARPKALPPAKRGVFLKIGRLIKDIFGQFLTGAFWKEAAKTVVHEMAVAFMYGFSKGFIHLAQKKSNPETAGIRVGQQATGASSAFSGGFSPTTTMKPSSGFMGSSSPRNDVPFPGF